MTLKYKALEADVKNFITKTWLRSQKLQYTWLYDVSLLGPRDIFKKRVKFLG